MKKDFSPAVRSCAVVKIEGLNQNRLLAKFAENGEKVWQIRRESARVMRLKIRLSSLKTLESIAEKYGFAVTVENRTGAVYRFLKLLPRLGLVLTLVALTVTYTLLYGFVWRVEISGNEAVDKYVIAETLAQAGGKAGVKKSAADLKAMESALRKMDGIAEATVYLKGTTLKVEVVESLDFTPRPPDTVKMITSKYDAEVTRIVVRKGTALVKTGERVFEGEPLISGDIFGTDGNILSSGAAEGEVYGKVVLKESVGITLRGERKVLTGRVKKSTTLSLFGLTIGKVDNRFEYAETAAVTHKLAPIPVRVTSVTAREVVKEEFELTEDEAKAEGERIVRERMSHRLIDGQAEEKLIAKQIGGVMYVELYVTFETVIGEI